MYADYKFYSQDPQKTIDFDVAGVDRTYEDADGLVTTTDWGKVEEIIAQLNVALPDVLDGTNVRGTFATDYNSDIQFVVDETSDMDAAVSTELLFRLHDLMLRFLPAQSVSYWDGPRFVDGRFDTSDLRIMKRLPDGTIEVEHEYSREELEEMGASL